MKKVGVIGAGANGLVMLKELAAQPEVFEIVGFERAGEVGGLWVYTEKTGTDVDGLPVHTAVYNNVRTNTPKDCMHYLDFPYPNPLPSFMGHREVMEYLQNFASHYQLHQHIKFYTLVTRVNPVTPGSRDTRWEVTYCSTKDQSQRHQHTPYIPDIAGLETFSGTVIHSHDYRVPERFKGQTVVCYGGGPSAMDLAMDLNGVARKVILSVYEQNGLKFVCPDDVLRKPGIGHVTGTSVVFTNGEEEKADVIIICTGYRYSFPFFTDACRIVLEDEGRRVTPLYKHMFHIEHPTLLLHGVVDNTAGLNVADIMSKFAAKIMNGSVNLPSKEDMEKDTEEDLARHIASGKTSRVFHKLAAAQNELVDSLSAMAGTPTLSKGGRALFHRNVDMLQSDTLEYRNYNYEIVGDTFKIL